ncbi:MAG: hypothetical protein KGI38_04905 [Thaumarchaeota archaeon]|nr:hypothetical protein [Nitrososphaerota archaeon]
MSAKARSVKDYLDELEETVGGREQQVKEGLEIYIGLWKKAIEKGIVGEADGIDDALVKIDKAGGLYKAAED